jgi:hypothetical protein
MDNVVPLNQTSAPMTLSDATALLQRRTAGSTSANLTLAEATTVLSVLDESLVPAPVETQTVLIDETMALWATPDNFGSLADFYLEAVEEFPEDILRAALKTVRLKHVYPTLPKPADFHQAGIGALEARQSIQRAAQSVLRRVERETRE